VLDIMISDRTNADPVGYHVGTSWLKCNRILGQRDISSFMNAPRMQAVRMKIFDENTVGG